MRSDLLLLTFVLSLLCQDMTLAQGRLASESGGAAPAATGAAHLKLKPAEWRSLNERQIVMRSLAASHAKELAGFGAVVADAAREEFIKAFSALSVFKRSETTLACGRFSAQPVIEDLAELEVSDKDLYALMRAKVKESNIKLAEADIARILGAAGASPYFSPKLKAKLAAEYKQILLDRKSVV